MGRGPAYLEEAIYPLRVALAQPLPRGICESPPGLVLRIPVTSHTGTSSKVMPVTLLCGQLCHALFRRKARALVCRPSRATNFRKVQFWMLMGPS